MRAFREKLKLNQTDFWGRVGVTQSAGSRYEAGVCEVPKPVRMLISLAYDKDPSKALAKLRGARK